MTLLSICQDAADEMDVPRPSTIVGNTSSDAQKLLRYANRAGIGLMKAVPWQILRKEKTFTGLASETQTSILPADFDRFVPETFWDRTNVQLLSGPVSSVEWQSLKANSYSDTSNPRFAYRGGTILVIPTLTGGESLAFEYISSKWAQSAGAVAQTTFLTDTDTAILDEELLTRAVKYLFLDGEGQPAGTAAADFATYLNDLVSNDQPTSGVLVAGDIFGGGRHFSGAPSVSGISI